MSTDHQAAHMISDAQERSPQGPGVCGTCQDVNVATTVAAARVFDLSAWAGGIVMLDCEVTDFYVLFMAGSPSTDVPGSTTSPTPVQGANFDETVVAKTASAGAATPSVVAPARIVAAAHPRAFVVHPMKPYLAYKAIGGAVNLLRAQRG